VIRAGRAAALVLAAGLLASACHAPPVRPAPADAALPDSVRLRPLVQRAVEARVAADPHWRSARRRVAEGLYIRMVPSAAVPRLRYAWGFFSPTPSPHGASFTGIVGVLGDSARILEDAEDWAALVGPEWAPRGPADVIAACVEVLPLTEERPRPPLVYHDTASTIFGMTIPAHGEEMKRRFANPAAERAGDGAWQASFWTVRAAHSLRHQCRLRPAPRPRR
jgi:hypothetical protein